MEEDIIGFEALWDSMMKCKRGVMWKDSVAGFVLNGVKEAAKLSEDLENGTYKERSHKYFTILYPKERDIMSINFRDRVYQRSLNDVAIYPAMAKGFIHDNCACQKGKGTDFARDRLKCHMQRFYRKHGADGYVLKMDVRKYYDSMIHEEAKAVFRKKLPENVYNRAATILDGFPGDVGFNPGSQIIQIVGLSMLDGVDHLVKDRLRVKHYIRYMDDMLVIGESIEELETIREAVAAKLAEIGFQLHSEKTKIYPLREGVLFLGYQFRLTGTGKVVMSVDPERLKSARRKYYRLVKKSKAGLISRKKVDESYRCFREHASKGNGYLMLKKMDAYYNGLWEDDKSAKDNQAERIDGCARRDQPT